LNTKKSRNNINNNARSEWDPTNLQFNNRYSIFNFFNIAEDPADYTSSIITGSSSFPRDIPRTKRLSFSQAASAGGSAASRTHARTHVINAGGISLASLLCFLNGHAPNLELGTLIK